MIGGKAFPGGVRYQNIESLNLALGSGADTVTRVKQARLTSAARRYLGHHPNHAQRACRFDVVSIGSGINGAELRWIKAAFDSA